MSGIKELDTLLASMSPKLQQGQFVFCTVKKNLENCLHLNPIATFVEPEGLTLVIEKHQAESAKMQFDGVFKQITLMVHSSLSAVGLTAAVANKLAEKGISANVVAAYYHDHIFVPESMAEAALLALQEFSQ